MIIADELGIPARQHEYHVVLGTLPTICLVVIAITLVVIMLRIGSVAHALWKLDNDYVTVENLRIQERKRNPR